MNTLDQYADLRDTIGQWARDLGDCSHTIVERAGALLDLTLGPLSEGQKAAVTPILRTAKRLSSIADDFNIDQILSLEHTPVDVRFEEAELDDRYLCLSEMPAMLANELRSPVALICGYSDILLNAISDPLTPQQREHISDINRLAQTLQDIVQASIHTARHLWQKQLSSQHHD